MTVYKITEAEQARDILLSLGNDRTRIVKESIVFEFADDIKKEDMPLVYRACSDCEDGSVYVGHNVHGFGLVKSGTFCANCGYSMPTKAEVSIALQGDAVIHRAYYL